MKFPYSMLQDFVQTKLTAAEAGDLLTMAGFELEGIEEVNGEPVLDIKVMSNRGDGLSVFGLAREVLAKDQDAEPTDLYRAASDRFTHSASNPNTQHPIPTPSVSIETPACTRYACRIYVDIKNGASPAWIQERLMKAGQRPISLLVDLTNYVMLELGQPLHAFDFDKLKGGCIVVRQAKQGEKITTLDGVERELTPNMMMICDAERPVAVAGVMGGADTEVSAAATRVLLESAHFVSTSVRATRRALGLNTEASYRFERSVDPEGVVAAIHRFTQLLGEVEGGEIVDVYPSPPKPKHIKLRSARATLLLGMPIQPDEAKRHLSHLGFELKDEAQGQFQVTPPSWRPDIDREEDLIEEIGRVHGYERIPEALPHGSTTLGGAQGYEAWKDQVRETVLRLAFTQTISHTLRDKSPLDNPRFAPIGPRGINDPEMMWLRSSTLASLADAARRNGGRDLHLFEMGQVFGKEKGRIVERTSLGMLSQGALQGAWWNDKHAAAASFFTLKGALEQLAQITLTGIEFRAPSNTDSRLHPTRQAEILAPSGTIGVIGQIDPDTAEKAGLPEDTILAEIDIQGAYGSARQDIHVRQISRNPAVRRDIAFLIDKSVPFEKVSRTVAEASRDLLERHWLFDIYEGKGVPEGKHSLAIALQLRKVGVNLTDEEANQAREKVVQALATLGATPR